MTIPEQFDLSHREAPSPDPAHHVAPEREETPAPPARMTPLAPERFGLQLTLDKETFDLLEEARALTGHMNPKGEIHSVLKGALKCYVSELRKQKFAATDRPGHSRPSPSASHIPAAVKRAVRERDGGRCAFVSDEGRRCQERARLEFDHIEPVARGGKATEDNVRLVCRAHNQYAAERAFGAEFMERKRREARERARRSKQ